MANQEQPLAKPESQPKAQPTSHHVIQPLAQSIKMKAVSSSGLPTLRFGNTGSTVRTLQRLLISNGYFVQIDGVFGALTEVAVKAFQSSRGLKADGVVGARTWAVLSG
ncbi:MAG: peptidoglycan-binding protein [Brasilonema octagenarum HA4186-MV1]|jgi:peptidoglycan hydrolase-like protein with peptidoglycan-binding domain|uniref:Peptidoglycan-binding protein n=2 Tax=Brasilonema TaxID=383614 RepID=A0A856MFM8_9CYAN|nr:MULTISPECIES: peptidoglycan-binding domain-containing protein [Brasilonema]MBW4629955.1 peptidoglycan-binding protein [Brasilonema octagenarum HA4186-MV1]NMF64926.1 peptidoglycan-binding protein [Brasilonema octagenarum UFV-OR1]QDL10125.1 peptidoglycan-binding protein [Brasilonema sennae CENA114]QDL16478.1 peptidoglycan-binding protein [Brasilonema octagenarum UFV-E1]